MKRALVIGNSDGIGLALTRRLLAAGWRVVGVSRSPFPEPGPAPDAYSHHVADIRTPGFEDALRAVCAGPEELDLCVYCAGVGQEIDLEELEHERPIFEVNLMGAVSTIEHVLPGMLAAGRGHIIGLSSQADALRDPFAPSYAASKAGLSAYLESLDKAISGTGVRITNIRFGFVDTKMAKADVRPFMITPERAARVIEKCLRKRPRRHTHPWRMAALLFLVRLFS